jgi:hypothetical protein
VQDQVQVDEFAYMLVPPKEFDGALTTTIDEIRVDP